MKVRKAIISIIILTVMVLSFESCKVAGVEIDERINMFIDDLNNDRANAYKNFHPENTDIYYEIGEGYWDTHFPADGPYSISGLDDSDSNNVTGTISGPGTFGGPKSTIFKMAKDGSDWQIEELTLNELKIVW